MTIQLAYKGIKTPIKTVLHIQEAKERLSKLIWDMKDIKEPNWTSKIKTIVSEMKNTHEYKWKVGLTSDFTLWKKRLGNLQIQQYMLTQKEKDREKMTRKKSSGCSVSCETTSGGLVNWDSKHEENFIKTHHNQITDLITTP